jgi:hypothetical protein
VPNEEHGRKQQRVGKEIWRKAGAMGRADFALALARNACCRPAATGVHIKATSQIFSC